MLELIGWLTACVVVGVGALVGVRIIVLRVRRWWIARLATEWCAGNAEGIAESIRQTREKVQDVLLDWPTSRGLRDYAKRIGCDPGPLPKRPRPSSAPTEETNP